jgi:hypothetical protein
VAVASETGVGGVSSGLSSIETKGATGFKFVGVGSNDQGSPLLPVDVPKDRLTALRTARVASEAAQNQSLRSRAGGVVLRVRGDQPQSKS